MKKGIKKGAMVTGYLWYMPRRVYGRLVGYYGRNIWAIEGNFGIAEIHGSSLRPVKKRSIKP